MFDHDLSIHEDVVNSPGIEELQFVSRWVLNLVVIKDDYITAQQSSLISPREARRIRVAGQELNLRIAYDQAKEYAGKSAMELIHDLLKPV